MAAFATLAAAESRARTKVADGTWVNAHSCQQKDGTIAVRVQRYMSSADADHQQYGEWVELTDDAAV